ncbi:hypothetical protein OJF2_44790 [Aquisphaera giovannonii]|uniref:Uncharacterized protein n=1 Tax=Aquisphaera giovannonii TaxID=406548 RepID=A0A5B9W5K0_9BACT|nr:hypothetical protein [Aquisphaera giovannonii]QEH35922.1 hypothetical protein OJF2_44790 [Aquisphaera giovannonii]
MSRAFERGSKATMGHSTGPTGRGTVRLRSDRLGRAAASGIAERTRSRHPARRSRTAPFAPAGGWISGRAG